MAGINAHGTSILVGDGGSAGSALSPAASGTEQGNPTIVNAVGHGLRDGQRVTVAGVTGAGAVAANGTWPIDKITVDVFTLPVSTTGDGAGTIVITPVAQAFTAIASCKDITLPSAATDEIDITTHDSLGKEFMDGDTDYGEVGFDINYNPALSSHALLRSLSASKDERDWQAVMVDANTETWEFAGWVKTFTLSAPVSGVYTATVAIRVTGAPSVS